MEKVTYRGWSNCCRIANGKVELIVTGDVGPRVIRFGVPGGENLFKEFDEMMGRTDDDEWLIYGGHRFWHAPEEKPRTYYPDNAPVEVREAEGVVRLLQPVETTTGIRKEIDIALDPKAARVKLTHRLINESLWAVELAPWALTVLDAGGKAIIPFPPRGSHETTLLPTNTMTVWAYTDMSDPRWTWGQKYIMLKQDAKAKHPQKIGVMVPDGWVACAIKGQLFVKTFTHQAGARYPDWGCSAETFTNNRMIELETLGPLTCLPPGGVVEHVEEWRLFTDVPEPRTDADVDRHVLPKVKAIT
jgi:hypothetical protein